MKNIPFTSMSQDWRTPRHIYEKLDLEFSFTDDPCPNYSLIDGLKRPWGNVVFVNPPFKEIHKWVEKAWAEHKNGKTIVLLIPSRTDTRWWHDYCMKASEIRFIKGRLKYEGAKYNAPFPSCVVVFQHK